MPSSGGLPRRPLRPLRRRPGPFDPERAGSDHRSPELLKTPCESGDAPEILVIQAAQLSLNSVEVASTQLKQQSDRRHRQVILHRGLHVQGSRKTRSR